MSQFNEPGSPIAAAAAVSSPRGGDPKARIVDALMELAAERRWEDISLSDIALRAGMSLADFRDHFPSKGAVLAGFARHIDRIVLEGTSDDHAGESAKERLFDVLMRRIDALKPYRDALQSISDWSRGDLMAGAALNGVLVNSMRFMLEAAGIDSEGPVGTLKLQGLAMAWNRVLDTWFEDDDPGLAATMAALDRELTRGDRLVSRAEDLQRLTAPLRAVGRALIASRRTWRQQRRDRYGDRSERPWERRGDIADDPAI
ncbi:MAG: helix-turn-helix transcriptional regulator [Methylobacteriaceae bacterium]|nr:helix-turn-helix transcriptional regulator [Methylobacteriaceae bacterium]MBV9394562.1 helix-turn-helix transcriptional regulator [Methylobacteriaceae bacterium]